MKRKCVVLHSSSDYGSDYDRHICVDEDSGDEIFACIEKKDKKWKLIVERTLTQPNIYWDCYAKEGSATAIKFFDEDNTRIYCREISIKGGKFYVVCAVLLLSKKVQKNDKRINEIIKKISNYEYEIIE